MLFNSYTIKHGRLHSTGSTKCAHNMATLSVLWESQDLINILRALRGCRFYTGVNIFRGRLTTNLLSSAYVCLCRWISVLCDLFDRSIVNALKR